MPMLGRREQRGEWRGLAGSTASARSTQSGAGQRGIPAGPSPNASSQIARYAAQPARPQYSARSSGGIQSVRSAATQSSARSQLKEALKEPGAFSKVLSFRSPGSTADPLSGPSAPSPAPRLDLQKAQAVADGGRASSSRRSHSVDEIGLHETFHSSIWDGAAGRQSWHQRPRSKGMVYMPEPRPRSRANKRVYPGMHASTSHVVLDDEPREARHPAVILHDDDCAGISTFARKGRAEETRLAFGGESTPRRRIEITLASGPAGAPAELAGTDRKMNVLFEPGREGLTGRRGKTKFDAKFQQSTRNADLDRCDGRRAMAPPHRSQIWDVVYSRDDKDDTRGLYTPRLEGVAGRKGGDLVNMRELLSANKKQVEHHACLPRASPIYHHAGPDCRPDMRRSASEPPWSPGTRAPPFSWTASQSPRRERSPAPW